jgi:hypothetical protein
MGDVCAFCGVNFHLQSDCSTIMISMYLESNSQILNYKIGYYWLNFKLGQSFDWFDLNLGHSFDWLINLGQLYDSFCFVKHAVKYCYIEHQK